MRLLKISACFIALFSLIFASHTFAKQLPLFTPCNILIQIGNSDREPGQKIPAKYTDKLTVNTDNNHRLYSFAGENEGIAELRELTAWAEKEEFWAFLPEKNMWIELGFKESYGAVSLDQEFLKTIIRDNDDLMIYHIHLKHYLEVMGELGYSAVPPSWLILPSLDDAALMVYFSSLFYAAHPAGGISWSILSPLGRTDYNLTEKGLKHYGAIQQDSFLLNFFRPAPAETDANGPASSCFDIRSDQTIQDLIRWANHQTNDYLAITFSPAT